MSLFEPCRKLVEITITFFIFNYFMGKGTLFSPIICNFANIIRNFMKR